MKGENTMKKILFAIAIIMTMVLNARAQRDGFFSSYEATDDRDGVSFALPSHFGDTNESAPLSTGLLILTALGTGYAVAKKKINK